jgi:hypothetical protein
MAVSHHYHQHVSWPEMWSAVASEARHRFGIDGPSSISQSAVAAALCRRTPNGGTCEMRPVCIVI